PPNALAHATGHVESSQMARVGAVLGIVGVLLSFVMVWILHTVVKNKNTYFGFTLSIISPSKH
ncbi:hypothetical protein BTO03_22895, partial [Vibrio parahaemolyticus]|uniref:hypothetical protein n=1 Tax=Vibrio parahaemolyticus TaxID=670 RepID=UPI000B6DFD31